MIVFDTLSELESYEGVFPSIRTIIDVMDRSLPYEQGDGEYDTPEKSSVRYVIDSFLTSDKGFEAVKVPGKHVMEIVLEGDEMISLSGSVLRMQTGRFAIYPGDADLRRGLSYALPEHTRTVRFLF